MMRSGTQQLVQQLEQTSINMNDRALRVIHNLSSTINIALINALENGREVLTSN